MRVYIPATFGMLAALEDLPDGGLAERSAQVEGEVESLILLAVLLLSKFGGAVLSRLAILVAIVVAFFYFYVGLSAMMVGIKSLYFGILVGPSFLIGMLGFGRALAFAKHIT